MRGCWRSSTHLTKGWWTLELLLTAALCVFLSATGMIAMYQVMGTGQGLYAQNEVQQVELARILLEIENDFYNAQRVYVWDQWITQSSADLTTNTHAATSSSGSHDLWMQVISPVDDSTFLTNWKANAGTIGNTASGSLVKYYTLLFLGTGKKINSVVYLTITDDEASLTYSLRRLADNGTSLVLSNEFKLTATGFNVVSNDQSDSLGVLPSITRHGSIYSAITIRMPTAFSKALKDLTTGNQARRVKYTADAWGTWTFVPGEARRWIVQ